MKLIKMEWKQSTIPWNFVRFHEILWNFVKFSYFLFDSVKVQKIYAKFSKNDLKVHQILAEFC